MKGKRSAPTSTSVQDYTLAANAPPNSSNCSQNTLLRCVLSSQIYLVWIHSCRRRLPQDEQPLCGKSLPITRVISTQQSRRLCAVHNKVNERLHKPEFDCAHLSDEYDCGCGDAPIAATTDAADPMDLEDNDPKDDMTGVDMIRGGR